MAKYPQLLSPLETALRRFVWSVVLFSLLATKKESKQYTHLAIPSAVQEFFFFNDWIRCPNPDTSQVLRFRS